MGMTWISRIYRNQLLRLGLFGILLFGSFPAFAQNVLTPDPAHHILPGARWQPDRPLGVRLVSARNSSATGPIVLTGVQRPVQAQITDLQHEMGGAPFPANLVEIRYGFAGMHPEPQDGGTQVIWVTAEVPAGAPTGNYRGEVRIPGGTNVPVLLEVGEWVAPRPSSFAAVQSYIQSPHNINQYYEVDIWSEEHFEYLRPSLTHLGRLGSNVMYLPMTGETHFGNVHTIVRYTGSDNNLVPEFSALERYLQMWDELVGPPRFVVAYMYESGREGRTNTLKITRAPARGGGGGEVVDVPIYYEDQGAMLQTWRQTYDGVQQRLRALGWEDTELLIGIVGDNRTFRDPKTRFFEQVAPGVRWKTFTHGRGDPRVPTGETREIDMAGLNFALITYPYSPRRGRAFSDSPPRGPGNWQNDFPFLTSLRETFVDNVGRIETMQPFFWRYKAMASMLDRYNGFSRIGFDFIPVDGELLMGRYHRWNNLTRDNTRHMVYPGPDGVLSTQAVEMSREGNAMAQAFVVLHDALTLEEHADKLPDALRERVVEVRDSVYSTFQQNFLGGRGDLHENLSRLVGQDWQTPLRELYDIAGEVSEALGLDTQPAGPVRRTARPQLQMRQWTSADGRTVQGAFQGYANGQVGLTLPNGQTAAIPMEALSEADRDWVRETTGVKMWRNPEGVGVEARLLVFDGRQAQLESQDGRRFVIPIDALHAEEQAYLRENHAP